MVMPSALFFWSRVAFAILVTLKFYKGFGLYFWTCFRYRELWCLGTHRTFWYFWRHCSIAHYELWGAIITYWKTLHCSLEENVLIFRSQKWRPKCQLFCLLASFHIPGSVWFLMGGFLPGLLGTTVKLSGKIHLNCTLRQAQNKSKTVGFLTHFLFHVWRKKVSLFSLSFLFFCLILPSLPDSVGRSR